MKDLPLPEDVIAAGVEALSSYRAGVAQTEVVATFTAMARELVKHDRAQLSQVNVPTTTKPRRFLHGGFGSVRRGG